MTDIERALASLIELVGRYLTNPAEVDEKDHHLMVPLADAHKEAQRVLREYRAKGAA